MNKTQTRLNEKYFQIKNNCCIVTVASKEYYHQLISLIVSIKKVFIEHPKIYIFDLGLKNYQKKELDGVYNICLKEIPEFISHWKSCYTWKSYILLNVAEDTILYLDAGNVALKDFKNIFLSINKNNYFLAAQGIKNNLITPIEYLDLVSIDRDMFLNSYTFASSLIGFKKNTKFYQGLKKVFDLSCQGYTLGYSKIELHRIKSNHENIIRYCHLFRHDMTLLNLCIWESLNNKVKIHKGEKYVGWIRDKQAAHQIFYNHRNDVFFIKKYLIKNISKNLIYFFINRFLFLTAFIKILVKNYLKKYSNEN